MVNKLNKIRKINYDGCIKRTLANIKTNYNLIKNTIKVE
jgi:hypothetical protein